jgi:hypothetical protein
MSSDLLRREGSCKKGGKSARNNGKNEENYSRCAGMKKEQQPSTCLLMHSVLGGVYFCIFLISAEGGKHRVIVQCKFHFSLLLRFIKLFGKYFSLFVMFH